MVVGTSAGLSYGSKMDEGELKAFSLYNGRCHLILDIDTHQLATDTGLTILFEEDLFFFTHVPNCPFIRKLFHQVFIFIQFLRPSICSIYPKGNIIFCPVDNIDRLAYRYIVANTI